MEPIVFSDQELVDLAFRDMDHLLHCAREPDRPLRGCIACRSARISTNAPWGFDPGAAVCDDCGAVQPGPIYSSDDVLAQAYPRRSGSNYKRVHHWHERISQLLLLEVEIPFEQLFEIAKLLCDGTHAYVDKDAIRPILRSLNMQTYIEKWLQIIYRITGVRPPIPGKALVGALEEQFLQMQRPFELLKQEKRRNFLNYNYVFTRLLQRLGCHKFCMFFPMLKGVNKLQQLDETYSAMCAHLQWEVKPLVYIASFAVQLREPQLLLRRLASEYVPSVPAALATEPSRMVFRTLDRHAVERLLKPRAPRHSSPPAQRPRRSAASGKHRPLLRARRSRSARPQIDRRPRE